MRNILLNMLNAKSGGQMTYMVNLLSEISSLANYKFTFLINIIADNHLKRNAVNIPENVRIYTVLSRYSHGATSYIWQVFNLPRIVQEIKPEYVYAPTHIAYKVPNVKTILAMRNMAIPSFLKIDIPLRMRLNLFFKYLPLRYSLHKADKIVAVSNYVKDFLKKTIGKEEKDIFTAYHMINSLHKGNVTQLERFDNFEKDNYLIFIPGSYYRYKQFHILLDYMESVNMPSNAKVIFAGDESDRKYVKQLRQHVSDVYKPIFKMSLNIDEMIFLYKYANIVILSSQIEACPNIALESLANKSRILASDIPPFREILGGFANYFNINDKSDFVKKFEMVVSSVPDATVQQEQMEKVSCGSNIIDVLHFSESD